MREFTGSVPLRSHLGNDVTARLFRGATGWRLRDTRTGLRGYPAGGYDWMLEVAGNRYEYELSALLRAREPGLEVEEVGIATVYEPGNASSHLRPLRDSARIYAPLLRFTGASLAGFVIDRVGVMVPHLLTGSLLVGVVGGAAGERDRELLHEPARLPGGARDGGAHGGALRGPGGRARGGELRGPAGPDRDRRPPGGRQGRRGRHDLRGRLPNAAAGGVPGAGLSPPLHRDRRGL